MDFRNFKPEKIRPKKFRGKKIRLYERSRQNFLAGKNFKPHGHNAIGRKNFRDTLSFRRKTSLGEGFSGFHNDLPEFFSREKSHAGKKFGRKADSGAVSLKIPLLIIKSVGLGTRMCSHYPSFDLVRLPSARSSGAMSTAAPEGMLPRRIKKKNKKLPCPPPGGALMRDPLVHFRREL
ncbi:MAG: hypothetical protein ACLQMU_07385 [Methanoregula sp.]|uniref:hypothetical protein n=1 Tax=Methanoregula sp. TaxID=2052170 RepID=UPI003C35A02A